MTLPETFDAICETLDKLMTLDVTARGAAPYLYPPARARAGRPVTAAAAAAICDAVSRGDRVVIVTGFPSRSFLIEGLTETDGPTGSAVLARCLEECLGAIPIVVTHPLLTRYVEPCLTAAGLILTDLERALRSKAGDWTAAATTCVPFTGDRTEAQAAAVALLDRVAPTAMVSVETPGPAADGRCYTATGRESTDHLIVRGEALFAEAGKRGVLTVGIGDGGNELGLGAVAEATRRHVRNGEIIACAVPATVTVPAAISNWGACAIGAAVAAAMRQPEVLERIDPVWVNDACALAGAVDGSFSRPMPRQDGTPRDLSGYIWNLMRYTVDRGLGGRR